MTTITILPEKGDTYRALSGDKQSTGRTAGEALDALSSQLTEEEGGTLVIVQNQKPDQFFNAAQQERLAELTRLRAAGGLTAAEEQELAGLIEAEINGARERAEALIDAAGSERQTGDVSSDEGLSVRKTIEESSYNVVPGDDLLERAVLSDEMLELAMKISPKLHVILDLMITEDLTLKDIALRIGESYANTRTIFYRGIRELNRSLGLKSEGTSTLLIKHKTGKLLHERKA
ncbi:MAG TPA: hypothetical protein VF546_23395 [Pyrinomonadaceae bacterium]|jgi:DNA-directed RNA polymerase specialized sigma24 family protein